MSVKQRLIEFAKSQEKSVRAFEIKSGLTIGYINSIRVSIQPDKLKCIASHYPNLNAEWLLTGKGAMLRTESNVESSREDRLIAIIESQQRTIEELSKKL